MPTGGSAGHYPRSWEAFQKLDSFRKSELMNVWRQKLRAGSVIFVGYGSRDPKTVNTDARIVAKALNEWSRKSRPNARKILKIQCWHSDADVLLGEVECVGLIVAEELYKFLFDMHIALNKHWSATPGR